MYLEISFLLLSNEGPTYKFIKAHTLAWDNNWARRLAHYLIARADYEYSF